MNFSTSAEDSFLIEVGSAFNRKTHRKRILRILDNCSGSLDWNYILKAAKENKILPQLCDVLNRLRNEMPNELILKLEHLKSGLLYLELKAKYEVKEVSNLFKESKIPFILFKGFAISQYYPNYISRYFVDLDFLVPTFEVFYKAGQLLSKAGYIMFPETTLRSEDLTQTHFVKNRRYTIELHNEVQWGEYLVHINKNLLFRNAEEIKLNNIRIPIISSEDSLLLLSARILEAGFFLIRDICDVEAIIKKQPDRFNWTYLINRARQDNLKHSLFCLLYLSSKFYDQNLIPESVLAELSKGFFSKFVSSLIIKSKIKLPLLWNSPVRKVLIFSGLITKFKRRIRLFSLHVKKLGILTELKLIFSKRRNRLIDIRFLRRLF